MTETNPRLLPAPPLKSGIPALVEMLTTCRPYRGAMDSQFCHTWLSPLGARPDDFGNYILRIGDSPIMYSSHTDTVHGRDGTQRLHIDTKANTIQLAKKSRRKSSCLGADCTAGVWIMREMVLARKPGLYIFHRGEECGGIGSGELTEQTPHVVKGIKAAIAFDRRRTGSIITHQWGGRCCSDAFAESLGAGLYLGHAPDDGGSFTDTANYTDLVGECTNVSVGFENEHTPRETLDVAYLSELRHAMIELDTDSLVFKREPGEHEPRPTRYYYSGTYRKGRGVFLENESPSLSATSSTARGRVFGYEEDSESDFLHAMVVDNPHLIAALLDMYGLGAREVADYVYEKGGLVPSGMLADPYEDEGGMYHPGEDDSDWAMYAEAIARDDDARAAEDAAEDERQAALEAARALFDRATNDDERKGIADMLARADAAIAEKQGEKA